MSEDLNSDESKTQDSFSRESYEMVPIPGMPGYYRPPNLAEMEAQKAARSRRPQDAPRIDDSDLGEATPVSDAKRLSGNGREAQDGRGERDRPEGSGDADEGDPSPAPLNLIQEVNCGKTQKRTIQGQKNAPENAPLENARKIYFAGTENDPVLEPHIDRLNYSRNHGFKIFKELYQRQHFRPAERLTDCATSAQFRQHFESGNIRLRYANFCQQPKLCPGCAAARSRKIVSATVDRAITILRKHPSYLPYMVTITIPNGDNLHLRLKHLLNCLTRFREHIRDTRRGKAKYTELAKMKAAQWQVEIKRGKNSGQWHPHLHGLIMTDAGPFDLDKLQQEVNSITGGKHRPNVQLTYAGKQIYENGLTPDQLIDDPEMMGIFRGDVEEIMKYTVKFEEQLTPADCVDVYEATARKRLVRSWGQFYGLKIDPDLNDYTEELGLYRDHLLRQMEGQYKTVMTVDGQYDGHETETENPRNVA